MRSRIRWVIIVVLVIMVAAGAWFWLRFRSSGFSAQEPPSALEEFGAITARKIAIPSRAKNVQNPVPNTPEAIAEAKMHWADHCATCHANNGSGNTEMGSHMYPRAPDMRHKRTQDMTDGELYFIIQNGIRLSGMPAWGKAEDENDEESWKLVHLIRHLPSLSTAEAEEMKKWNPASPQEQKNEREEEDFLSGSESTAPHKH